jgi:hypothetical protein
MSATTSAHALPAVKANNATVLPSLLNESSQVKRELNVQVPKMVFNQLASLRQVPVVAMKSVPNEDTHTSCESNGVVVTVVVVVGEVVAVVVVSVVVGVVEVAVVVGLVVGVVDVVGVVVSVVVVVGDVVGVVTSHP